MSECVAKYKWTGDAYVIAMQRHYGLVLREGFAILIKLTCGLLLTLIVSVVIALTVLPGDKPTPYWAFAGTALVCLYGLVYNRVNVWYWKRTFKKRENNPNEIKWLFSNDSIQMRTEFGEATLKWQGFLKYVEVKDGFLFYSTKNLFFWIPFTSFTSLECVEIVRALIVDNKCPFTQQK